jgi:uncharacterized protein (DUF1499 family)
MKITLYIILSLIVFVMIAFFFLGRGSAKGAALGLVDGRLAPCGSKPNCVSSEAGTEGKKTVTPLQGQSLLSMASAISAMGGIVTAQEGDYLSATFTSKTFKFVDDFEVRMDGDIAHIRSSSRVGYSDRGVNRARVETLRAALKS